MTINITEEDKEMLGLIESVARKSDCFGMSLNAMTSQLHCKVANHIVDKQYEKKHKQYQKAIDESRTQGMNEDVEEKVFGKEDVLLYMELLQRVAQHEDISERNPIDIALELGYSEQDVKATFEYMQQIMKDDEEEEQSIEVCCPKCGETRITTPNTGITCKGCGVRIVVGEDGEIRRVI